MFLTTLVTVSLAAAPVGPPNAPAASAEGVRAADVAVYKRAVDLVSNQWLNAPKFVASTAFRDAGEAAEGEVEWLLADTVGNRMTLRDGTGAWRAEVTLANVQDLPAALARVEDAVRGAGRPLGNDVDLRAELLTGVTRQLDRYSTVLHDTALARFDERLSGSLTGIGAILRSDAAGLYVTDLVAGGPAARAGLSVEDRVLRVDGVSTTGMKTADATARIRGPAGTSVTLLVRHAAPGGAASSDRVLTLRREAVELRNVRARVGPGGVGILTIEHVSEQTRAWLDDALAELRDQGGLREGLIVDLRGNTGGSLLQSALAADAFVGEGTLVTTVDRNGKSVPGLVARLEAHPDATPISAPMAILVDGQTASGSEILAGALARLQRAVVIGTPTFGKGTVQKLYPLAEALKLKLTVAEYLVEGLQRVADVGLAPDVALEPVEVSDTRTWVASAATRQNLPPTTPIVRYLANERRDFAVGLAAATLREAEAPDRATVLAALRVQAANLARAEDLTLQSALRARAIDWSPGSPTTPRADVALRLSEPAVAGRPTYVMATVRNLGPALRRSLVRLVSDAFIWDDLVLPVGALAEGASTTVRVRVTPSARTPARSDDVQAWIEAEGSVPVRAGSGRLDVLPEPPLHVGVRARLVPTPRAGLGRHDLVVEIRNTMPRTVDGVVAHLDFPGQAGVELVTALSEPLGLPASGMARTTLTLNIGPNAPLDTLRLRLRVTDDAEREVEVPLSLARSGAWAEVIPPELTVGPAPTVAPVGTLRIPVRARDDGLLDHLGAHRVAEVVDRRRGVRRVTTERDKLAWVPVRARTLDTTLEVPVRPGLNRYVVVVEDAGGVRTTREVCVLGEL